MLSCKYLTSGNIDITVLHGHLNLKHSCNTYFCKLYIIYSKLTKYTILYMQSYTVQALL